MSLLTSATVKYSLDRFSRFGSLRGGPSWFFAFFLDFPENDFWFDFFDMSENVDSRDKLRENAQAILHALNLAYTNQKTLTRQFYYTLVDRPQSIDLSEPSYLRPETA